MLRGFLMAVAMMQGTIDDCSPSGSIADITSMGLNPVSPLPGDNSTVWVAYDLSQDVTGGKVVYSTWVNNLPFPVSTVNLCDQEACPLTPGCYNSSGSSIFPDITGKIEARIEWFDQNDQPIWCVDTIYRI